MTPLFRKSQGGAVLLVSLVMLLVLTLLAVSSMRGVTLESRITANRAHDMQFQNVADAALREAEFRFYGPGNLVDKLEANAQNCSSSNTLKTNGLNKPCLLEIKTDRLLTFVETPKLIVANFLEVPSNIWMPYRGTDPAAETKGDAYYHSIVADETGNAVVNAEYGGRGEGSGTYFYLNNGKTGDALYLQSTHANIYLGLNN
ncbi:PilX N-terminal domain-containing pilus assembly protein [Pseudomonas lopnurensis]|uniref:PilX N-terminal domain-containing pilus assembly protein n=1 Tax=Pseudomonas lopnurensis TaxID=1477517 RepID=UPI00187A806A|nr:PilX N-terminal domain-containing pilus assembly protein [Pseudomonas lopnurensis]MBE7376135.1 pilus assembly protein PilX [Pseudomonas lopnurensis]